jgi:hypothetical protein
MAQDGAFAMVNFVDFDQGSAIAATSPAMPTPGRVRQSAAGADRQAAAGRPPDPFRRPWQRPHLEGLRPPREQVPIVSFPQASRPELLAFAHLRGYREIAHWLGLAPGKHGRSFQRAGVPCRMLRLSLTR